MTAVKFLLPASLVMSAFVGSASAQAPPAASQPRPETLQVGLSVPFGIPVGAFGRHVDSAAGISGGMDVGLGRSIVSVGGELSYVWYGSDERNVDLGPAIPELAGTSVKVTTDNAMLFLHGRVRLQPRHGRWRPYVDGLFGFDYIHTTTSIEDTVNCTGSTCSGGIESTNLDDWVPSLGVGAGVMVGLGTSPDSIRLDVSVRYLWGGEADYLVKGAIHNVGNTSILDISRSRTDMVAVSVGVAFGR
jgi:hypothetical protein